MDDNDPLITNEYTNNLTVNADYGLSDEHRKFKIKKFMENQSRSIDLKNIINNPNPDEIEDDDILKTNPVVTDDMKLKTNSLIENNGFILTEHGTIPQGTNDIGRVVKDYKNYLNINSIHRERTELILYPPNKDGLYTRLKNGNIEVVTAEILNNEFVPGPNDVPRPYISGGNANFIDSDGISIYVPIAIYKTIYKYRDPNYYEFRLPKVYVNVKSIKLISSEIPNTLGVITTLNNLCILDIKKITDGTTSITTTGTSNNASFEDLIDVPYVKTTYDFLLFQFTPGYYDFTTLASHIQTTLINIVSAHTTGLSITFTVTIDEITGKVSIKIISPSSNYVFHIKFWFTDDLHTTNPISQYDNLWYKLGFVHPYDVDENGKDLYVFERNNLFNFGINPLSTSYPPDTTTTTLNISTTFKLSLPYRYPDLMPNRYIYLLIQNMPTMIDIAQTNGTTVNFKNESIFAKIVMNVAIGKIAYNSYVSTPMIYFDTPLPRLDHLKIKFVDFAGTLVDFQHRQHSFTLEITEYLDQLSTNHYSSYRGTFDRTYA